MNIKQTTDSHSTTYQDALMIRQDVFVKEQKIPLAIEIDQENECLHFVLYDNDQPQGTVRLLDKGNHVFKIQRMAILKKARKRGYAKKLVLFSEAAAKKDGAQILVLGAQESAVGFYESIGYTVESDAYFEAGIKHFEMSKKI
ncbi:MULTISPECIES: GNAT family N-acetyltransferase [Vagococcus]|uniref:GNAT family acetyltransferase YjcF n=1 Tax=Vagococcus fluvialis bH819 TaxID=1255619 RepID=A0A1X6WKP6_9ENTE|nr:MULTISPECIES: GNAT family N-acetyltransferase [Vagococcus]SLM84901.1 GNAT family acetyltransferase YjcF [Vagococcus fluvialis bH819]HCM90441.1 GNAT family N-acetyltransferase [Vagococcus sp.]